jgi:hypothetical protein
MFSFLRSEPVKQSAPKLEPVEAPIHESSHAARLIHDTLRDLENVQQSQAEKIREQEAIIREQARVIHRQAAKIRLLESNVSLTSPACAPASAIPSSANSDGFKVYHYDSFLRADSLFILVPCPADSPPPYSTNTSPKSSVPDTRVTASRSQKRLTAHCSPKVVTPADRQIAFAAIRSLIETTDLLNNKESADHLGKKRSRDGLPVASSSRTCKKDLPSSFAIISRLWNFFGGKPPDTYSPPAPPSATSSHAFVDSSSDSEESDEVFNLRASKRRRLSSHTDGQNEDWEGVL